MLPELPQLPTATLLAAQAMPEQLQLPDSLVSRIGQAMHRLLEWGGASAERLRAVQRAFGLDAAQARQAADMAQRILTGAGAWAWDARAVQWEGNEVELYFEGQHLRLDRLVQRRDAGHEGQWWVLDYKSHGAPQAQPEVLQKMQTYLACVRSIYPGATVKAALLTAQGKLLEVELQ